MSIRTKTLLITGLTIFFLILTISVFSVRILLDGLNKREGEQVQTNIARVNDAIDTQLDYLRTKTTDWAYWDDTYNFIVDHNPQYIASNLVPDTFSNTKADSIVYIDAKGTAVYANSYDVKTKIVSTASASLVGETQKINEKLLTAPLGSDVTGIILLPEGPMYIAVRQILRSDNTGPARGSLLFGINLDDTEITHLANVTKTSLEVHRMDKPLSAQEGQLVKELRNKPFAMTVLSGTQIAGYTVRTDIDDKNILLIDVIQNRTLYLEGLKSVEILLVGFIGAGLIFLITVLLVLNRFVISPIVRLRVDVDRVTESGDLHQRLTAVNAKDELGALTRDLNKMLQSLEYTNQLLTSEQKKSRAYIDIVDVMIVVISADQNVILVNRKGCEVLELTPEEIIGKNWFDICVPQEEREKVKTAFNQVIKGQATYERFENTIIAKSGKRKIIAWHNTVIKNDAGEVIATLSSGEDVTETKESQEKTLAHAREVEELNKVMVGRELKMAELKKQIEAQSIEIEQLQKKVS